ncbi:tectonin domain-containing protein [Tenacibaculum agarivorans]|uniref:tectonin domain-containing protein n=1 Tax=Tenacibaculum agarivorans TaxID=1908389 RepID=UPI00094BA247|nr:tectonin domain-containing protein [Tenacibaculum agarivorans]
MKTKLVYKILFLLSISVYSQELPNRYIDEITNDITITKNITFSTNIPTIRTINLFGNQLANENTYGEVRTNLKMDIYSPNKDYLDKRPVIIFAFGGGFVNGSRTERSMVQLCEAFARRGFVTASIDYRLGLHIGDSELAKRAVYRALQDGRSAVRFFRKNASTYKIDPNHIYLSGHSAGAVLSYHVAYLDKESERPASTRNFMGRRDLGKLDDIGDNKRYSNGTLISGKANGVMGFAGAIGELDYIENSSEIPGVYFHSSDDGTVLYNTGEPFSNLSWIPGINLPEIHGSNVMNNRGRNVGAERKFYPFTNRGHGVHTNGRNIYPDIIANGAKYFHDVLLKPSNTKLEGDTNICVSCSSQTYSLTSDDSYYYDWKIEGGTFIDKDSKKNTISVKWSSTFNGERNISVTPYSKQLARGATVSLKPQQSCNWEKLSGLAIDVGAGNDNTYIVGTNNKVYKWENNRWNQIPGIDARLVDVSNGIPWVISTNNRIHRYLNNSWERIRGAAWDIGANGPHVYHMGRSNSIYKYAGNNSWDHIPGKRIKKVDAAANGEAWAIGMDDHVYQYQNSGWTGKKGNFRASDITVVDGTNKVWAVELGTGYPHLYKGNGIWEKFPGILTSISGVNGQLWGTNSSTSIYRNDCFSLQSRSTETSEIVTNTENDFTNEIKLYPNPVSDILHLEFITQDDDEVTITLHNMLGQIVYTSTMDNIESKSYQINMESFPKNLYILNVEHKGKLILTKKVIKK